MNEQIQLDDQARGIAERLDALARAQGASAGEGLEGRILAGTRGIIAGGVVARGVTSGVQGAAPRLPRVHARRVMTRLRRAGLVLGVMVCASVAWIGLRPSPQALAAVPVDVDTLLAGLEAMDGVGADRSASIGDLATEAEQVESAIRGSAGGGGVWNFSDLIEQDGNS
ncbi:MAG: hypothetical protein ACK54T_08105 [bacterium]